MKKLGIVLFIIVTCLLFFTSSIYAEIAKQGSGEFRGTKSGTAMPLLNLGEGRNQINWEEAGVILDAPENSPFYHATWYGIGTLQGHKGNFKVSGGMVFTCTNGDQIFATVDANGISGKGITSGGATFVGGTGECTGISGELISTPRPPTKSSKQGTYQQIVLGKISWKIP